MDRESQIETCFEYFTRQLKEGWRCISLDYPFVLLASKDVIQTFDLSNDVVTLRPHISGSNTELGVTGCGENFQCVYESSPDDDTSFVYSDYTSQNYRLDLYNIPSAGVSGTITSVTIYARCKYTFGSGWDTPLGKLKIACKTHNTTYYGTEEALGYMNYANYSKQYTTNPNTGSAWTWTEITQLEVGVSLKFTHIPPTGILPGEARCTQVYVEVNYSPTEPVAGVIGASSTVGGGIDVTWALSGAIPAVSSVSSLLGLQIPILGAITTASSVSGDLTKTKALTGSINAVSIIAGDLTGTWLLAGTTDVATSVTGSLGIEIPLSGQIASNSSVTSLLGLKRPFSGAVGADTSVTGDITRIKSCIGDINAVSVIEGDLTGAWLLAGTTEAITNISGELEVEHSLLGELTASSSVTGSLEVDIRLLSSNNFGTSNYAGPTGAFITYGDPTDFIVFITSTADPTADVGETYIGSTNPNSFIIYNSGHGRSEFRWLIPNNPYDKGDTTFAGPGGQTVTHTKGDTDYVPCIIPSANGNGAIGEWWITDIANTSFVIRNSGSGLTGLKWAIPRFGTGGKGASSFAGSDGVIITHNLNISGGYTPLIIPTEDPNGHLGTVYVTDITTNSFTVKNTGSATTTFSWLIANTTRGIVVGSNVSGTLSRALPLTGVINSLSTTEGVLLRMRQLAGEITSLSQLAGTLVFVAATQGFYYAKLGTDNLNNPQEASFNITTELNNIASFDYVIQNDATNRAIIANNLTDDFNIMRDDGTELLRGSIDSDSIEYFTEGEGRGRRRIRLAGFANFVDLKYLIYKRMAGDDAEDVGSVQDEDNSTSTFTDYTTEANNDILNDVPPTFGAVNDALYIGKDETFFAVQIKYSTKGIQAANTKVVIEYSMGYGFWATLDCIDESHGFTKAVGTHLLYMPNKADIWAKDTINGKYQYYIRFRITEGSYSTLPKLDQIKLSNADICRVQFNDTPADTILGYLLEGTGYMEDATDQCPSTEISIRGEYDSKLRWIYGLGSALTWEDVNGDKQRYDCWIDTSNKVHYKQHRGTYQGDISANFRALRNKLGYAEMGTRIFGTGGQEGINQKRAIVEDSTAQEEHKLREIVVEDTKITTYEALKEEALKSLSNRKDPLKDVTGDIDTKFWLDKKMDVGDKITVHQPDWNLNNQSLYIMRAAIGPSVTKLDLGTSQIHLEHMRSTLQRQMDINNVWMHGSVSTYVIGPEEDNFERENATTVHPLKMTIEVPSNARAINHVEISWKLMNYLSSVKGSGEGGGHSHSTGASGGGGVHLHTINNSGNAGAHLHTIADSAQGGIHLHTIGNSGSEGAHGHTIADSGSEGAHGHTIGNSGSDGAHVHDTSSEGAHTHVISTGGDHWHSVSGNLDLVLYKSLALVTAQVVGESAHTHSNPTTGGCSSTSSVVNSISWGAGNCDGGGSCISGFTYLSVAGANHNHSMGSTGSDGAHTHTLSVGSSNFVHDVDITIGAWTSDTHTGHNHPNSGEADHGHSITISIAHAHTVPNTSTGPAHAHTVPNTSTGPAHAHTVPNTSTGPAHAHTVPDTSTGPVHLHIVPDSATEPAHGHTIPDSSYTPPYEFPLEYGLFEDMGAGDSLELFINNELVGSYLGNQSLINITGWIHTGSNSVILQPIVGDNVRGRGKISAIATIFVENLK